MANGLGEGRVGVEDDAAVAEMSGVLLERGQHSTAQTRAPVVGVHPHAFDLGRVVVDADQAAARRRGGVVGDLGHEERARGRAVLGGIGGHGVARIEPTVESTVELGEVGVERRGRSWVQGIDLDDRQRLGPGAVGHRSIIARGPVTLIRVLTYQLSI